MAVKLEQFMAQTCPIKAFPMVKSILPLGCKPLQGSQLVPVAHQQHGPVGTIRENRTFPI